MKPDKDNKITYWVLFQYKRKEDPRTVRQYGSGGRFFVHMDLSLLFVY